MLLLTAKGSADSLHDGMSEVNKSSLVETIHDWSNFKLSGPKRPMYGDFK